MKKIILVLLTFFFLATVSMWIYADLILNEKGMIKEMKNSGVLTEMATLNSKRFTDLLERVEAALPEEGRESATFRPDDLRFVPDPDFAVTHVARDIGVTTDGSIQSRTTVELWHRQKAGDKVGEIRLLMYYYRETDLVEITVNGIPAAGGEEETQSYRAIVQWNSDTRFTEISHKYASRLFRPNVVKRIGAGLGICTLFFFLLVEKKKDNHPLQRRERP